MPHPRDDGQLLKHAAEQRLRRELATKSGHPLESLNRERVYARTGGKCTVCGLPVPVDQPWHEEHIVPLIAGGVNDYTNVGPAHPECNLVKGAAVNAG